MLKFSGKAGIAYWTLAIIFVWISPAWPQTMGGTAGGGGGGGGGGGSSMGSGGGIGGGGGSSGRPVAIIIVGPDGITIKPVVDVTKVALAVVTVLGAVVMLLRGMQRVNKCR